MKKPESLRESYGASSDAKLPIADFQAIPYPRVELQHDVFIHQCIRASLETVELPMEVPSLTPRNRETFR